MNNLFKKSVAVLASMGVLATTVNVSAFGASLVSEEFTASYEWMKSVGATTMATEQSFMPYNNVTRAQAPKMIINGLMAGNVELTKVRDYTANFSDLTSIDPTLQADIIKGYEYGLVNGWNGAYHGDETLTRAQVMTIVGRALYGKQVEDTTYWWKKYYQALNAEGIFTVENAQAPIKRYELALVLYRIATRDPNNSKVLDKLLCQILDTKNCEDDASPKNPDDNVKKGDLNVSVVDYSSAVKSAPKGIFVMNTIRFKASDDMTLESLTLKRTGLSSRTDIEKVWLERNGVAVTNAASVGSDGYAVLNFKNTKNKVSSKSSTQEFELVVQLRDTATAGNEISFDLDNVVASAKDVVVDGKTSTYRITGYEVVKLVIDDVNNAPATYVLGNQSDFVIGQFALASESASDDRDIDVKSLTFRNAGNIDFDTTFTNVRVYRDSKIVSKDVEINGRDITISLDKDIIKANKKAIYTIRAEVANLETVGENVQLEIRSAKDVIADEANTSFRANISFDSSWATTTEGELAKYTFNGGRVMLETNANFAKTVEAGVGSNDVTIAEGKITVTEAVTLPKLKVEYAPTAGATNTWNTTDPLGAKTIKRLVLEVGGSRYTADNSGNGTFVFENVYVKKTSDVKLLVSVDSQAELDKKINFVGSLKNLFTGKGEYQSNSEDLDSTDIAGSINISKIIIKDARFQLIPDALGTQSTVINDSSVKKLMSGKLSTKDKDVSVNSFEVKLTSNLASATDLVDVFLSINGQPFSNATLKNGATSFTFNSLGTITPSDDMTFEIKVQPTISNPQDVTLEVKAEGTDSAGNPAATVTEYSAKLEVKAKSSVEVTNIVANDRVVEPTVNAVLYEGTLNVKDGNAELTDFALTANKGNALTIENYKLYVNGEAVADNASAPTFSAMTENLPEGKVNVEVKAKVTSTASANTDDYVYDITDVTINGTPTGKTAKAYFAKGSFTLVKKSSDSSKVLTLELVNNSSDTIQITKLDLDALTDTATASVNGQVVDLTDGTVNNISVVEGAKVEIEIIAKTDKLVRLEGIEYQVVDGTSTYKYKLDKNYTSVGSWGKFYSQF